MCRDGCGSGQEFTPVEQAQPAMAPVELQRSVRAS
jgi:hypothetical protein